MCCTADLDVSYNRLTHHCCEALGPVLRPARPASRPRSSQQAQSSPEHPPPVPRTFRQLGVLTSLALEGNHIGDRGAIALCTALARPCSLTTLNLQACSLTEKSCISLCALLQVMMPDRCTPVA